MFDVNEYFKATLKTKKVKGWAFEHTYQEIRPSITLKDGTVLSLQASEGHYCFPRRDGEISYYEIEVGLLDCAGVTIEEHAFTKRFKEHQDGDSFVFGWVPVHELNEYINGVGLKEE